MIQNKLSHSALENKNPDEMFIGEKPEVSHPKIFGCLVYLHVPKVKRSKLDSSENKGIFVGYSDKSKAYRIYIPDLFIKLRRAKMSHLMNMSPSINPERPMWMNKK